MVCQLSTRAGPSLFHTVLLKRVPVQAMVSCRAISRLRMGVGPLLFFGGDSLVEPVLLSSQKVHGRCLLQHGPFSDQDVLYMRACISTTSLVSQAHSGTGKCGEAEE